MPRRAPVLLLAALGLACALALPASADETTREARIEKLGLLPKVLDESSGVAASRTQPGVLWTHNDSGGGPRFYAIRTDGTVLATYYLPAVPAVDWEDIALGRCPRSDGPCLFIADTGDNLLNRTSVSIDIVPEPTAPKEPQAQIQMLPAPHALELRYPDGSHDVEAIAFDPDGNLLLISKGQHSPIRVYRVDRAKLTLDSTQAELVDLDSIAPRTWLAGWITGAALAPSKSRLVVRTYTQLYFYRFGEQNRLVPDGPPCELGFAQPQGEGVDFLDEDTLVLTSETRAGRVGPILKVRCAAK
jgi:hypothetical protein